MLRCREVVELIGSERIVTASLRERFAVRMHLLICRHCRAYERSVRRLSAAMRRLAAGHAASDSERAAAVLTAVRRAAEDVPPADA